MTLCWETREKILDLTRRSRPLPIYNMTLEILESTDCNGEVRPCVWCDILCKNMSRGCSIQPVPFVHVGGLPLL